MYGTAEQVGQELVCPDCGTPTVVRPPAVQSHESGADAALLPVHEEYGLLEGVIQPAPIRPW